MFFISVLKNLSYSSSPLIQKKEEQYYNLNGNTNRSIKSIQNESDGNIHSNDVPRISNNSNSHISNNRTVYGKKIMKDVINSNFRFSSAGDKKDNVSDAGDRAASNKTEQKTNDAFALPHNPPENATKSVSLAKAQEKPKEKRKESFIQKIPPKTDNITVDYIVQVCVVRSSGYEIFFFSSIIP